MCWCSCRASARFARPPRSCASIIRSTPRSCRCSPGSPPRSRSACSSPSGLRRIVLATNVAETSLTVPGIKYVIDSGPGARQPLQLPQQGRDAAGGEDLACLRRPARGPLRPGDERGVRAPLQRGGLPGACGVHRSGDPALFACLGDPAHEGAEARRSRGLPVRRGAVLARDRRRLQPAHGTQCGRRAARADTDRRAARGAADRPERSPA